MSKAIAVGDLVQVIKWPCCGLNLGKIGIVSGIDVVRNTYCTKCGAGTDGTFPMPNAEFEFHGPGSLAFSPVAWLKRFDPSALPESITTEREEMA